MLSNAFLEGYDDQGPSGAHYGGNKEPAYIYEIDKYGNARKRPFNMARTYRRGAGEYNGYSSGYVSDRHSRRYLQQHNSPYANAGSKEVPKMEMHSFSKSKAAEGEKAGARHHASDVSDMENEPALAEDVFTLRQAGRQYAPEESESHYGLSAQDRVQGWTPMKARGLCRDFVMTYNGSCQHFAERCMTNPHSGAKCDPTIFHLSPEISQNTFHAGDKYEMQHLHPFEQRIVSLNRGRGKIQPLALVVTEYENPFPFPLGVVWDGFPPANRVQFGNNREKVMLVLTPGKWNGQAIVVNFREFLRAETMQLAASIDPNDLKGDIINLNGPGPCAVKFDSLVFHCICALAKDKDKYGNPLIEFDETKLSPFYEKTKDGSQIEYVANVPRETVTFVLSHIEKRMYRQSMTLDSKKLHWRLVPLNPGGSFKDYSGTVLQFYQENNPALFHESTHIQKTVTITCKLEFV